MATQPAPAAENEVTILARFLGSENGDFPVDFARYILAHEISDRDKARMHDFAVRNQQGYSLFEDAQFGEELADLGSVATKCLGDIGRAGGSGASRSPHFGWPPSLRGRNPCGSGSRPPRW